MINPVCTNAIRVDLNNTVEIVYNEHQDQAQYARYNRFSF